MDAEKNIACARAHFNRLVQYVLVDSQKEGAYKTEKKLPL